MGSGTGRPGRYLGPQDPAALDRAGLDASAKQGDPLGDAHEPAARPADGRPRRPGRGQGALDHYGQLTRSVPDPEVHRPGPAYRDAFVKPSATIRYAVVDTSRGADQALSISVLSAMRADR